MKIAHQKLELSAIYIRKVDRRPRPPPVHPAKVCPSLDLPIIKYAGKSARMIGQIK
jgi:hypothetical protein